MSICNRSLENQTFSVCPFADRRCQLVSASADDAQDPSETNDGAVTRSVATRSTGNGSSAVSSRPVPGSEVLRRLQRMSACLQQRYSRRPRLTWAQFSGTSLSIEENRQTQQSNAYARVLLRPEDFQRGTLIIWAPCQLIFDGSSVYEMDPNPNINYRPTVEQRAPGNLYSGPEYDLGFFAAIAVQTRHVTISLNGSTLQQSVLFALMQRWFSIISLADQAFIPNQGPADFGDQLDPAHGLVIENGTLGRSAHHGVHGNGARDVLIRNVVFEAYEVAALSVNGVKNFAIVDSTASGSSTSVPVAATFSAARFLLQFIDLALDITLGETGVYERRQKLIEARHVLQDQVNAAVAAVESGTPADIPAVFRLTNEQGLIDGNGYGLLFNVLGVAVNGFVENVPSLAACSQNVVVKNTLVKDTAAAVDQIVALRDTSNGRIVGDMAGSVLQIERIVNQDGIYVGTSVSDAKIAIGALYNASSRLQADSRFRRLYVPPAIVEWAELRSTPIADVPGFDFVYNGDSMFHLNKGVFGINANGVLGMTLSNVTVENVTNFGVVAELANHPLQTESMIGYTGDDAFGISLSSCQDVRIENTDVEGVRSECQGVTAGLCVRGQSSRVCVLDSCVESVEIQRRAESFYACNMKAASATIAAPLTEVTIVHKRGPATCSNCRGRCRR